MSGQDEDTRPESGDFEDDVNTDASFGEADVPVPGSSKPPPTPGRTDLHPGDGLVDELPDNDGEQPRDAGMAPDETDMTDTDLDNAEMDGAPDPR